MVLGVVLSFKINHFKSENLISKDILHGTYIDENNNFVTISFDVDNMKYFYYGLNENYDGDFIYLGDGVYRITSGEFENYFVKMINVKKFEMYHNYEKRIFKRSSYFPTIINKKDNYIFSCLFYFLLIDNYEY